MPFLRQLDDLILTTLDNLVVDEATDLKELVQLSVRCRQTDAWQEHLSVKAIERLAEIDTRVTGTTFPSRLRRFVLFPGMYEYFDTGRERLSREIDKLAQEAAENPDLLDSVLSDLVKGGRGDTYYFGHNLARHDTTRRLLGRIIGRESAAVPDATTELLGGYLRQVHDSDVAEWECILETIRKEPSMKSIAAEVTWRSGFSKSQFERILADYDSGEIDFSHFYSLMSVCVPRELDETHVMGLLTRWNALTGEKPFRFPL